MKKSKLFQQWGTFRKGQDAQSIQLSFASHLEYSLCKDQYTATTRDLYLSLALAARDRLIERWLKTQQKYYTDNVKRVYYLSAEYLMGRVLVNNLINLGHLRGKPQGHAGALDRAGGARGRGAGHGAGQRRPGPPGRLLPGLARDARDPGHRLRHPLRVRDLRPGHPQPAPGGAARKLAALRQPLGDLPPRDHLHRPLLRPGQADQACRTAR